jgi:hypothetical protein
MRAGAASTARIAIIGLNNEEHEWVRLLVTLLRDPDPVRSELTRQALAYLKSTPARYAEEAAAR